MTFADAFAIVASAGLLSTAAAYYLFKRLMDMQVQKVINAHKAELDKKAAALKTDLDIYAHERTVGLTRLDELRAAAIQELYSMCIQWQEIYLEITGPALVHKSLGDVMTKQRLTGLIKHLVEVGQDLSIKTRDKAIFFDEGSHAVIARYGRTATFLAIDFYAATLAKWEHKEMDVEDIQALYNEARNRLEDTYKKEYKQATDALIGEFRRLMRAERLQRPL